MRVRTQSHGNEVHKAMNEDVIMVSFSKWGRMGNFHLLLL